MELNFNLPDNIINIVSNFFVWCVIIYLAYQIYQKQTDRPKIWKLAVVIVIGLFSFSINWQLFSVPVKIAVLPLGVWILYVFFNRRNRDWQVYRRFAWLGFWANFIFLAATLLVIPIHNVVYPKEEVATYISKIENATLVKIHPSAMEGGVLDKDTLKNQLHTMTQETIYSDQWYQDTYMNRSEINEVDERFPYQLIGTSAAWGSGLHTVIFIENDGKGMLITTAKEQLYFRFDESIIEGVE